MDIFREYMSYSLKELVDQTNNDGFKRRSKNCKTLRIKYHRTSGAYLFLVRCKESYSNHNGHIVSIKFDDSDLKKYKRQSRPYQLDVKLFCECEAFKYLGSNYASKQFGYNLDGTGTDIFPEITDPNNNNLVCKHIMAVRNKTLKTIRMRQLDKLYKQSEKNQTDDSGDLRKNLYFRDKYLTSLLDIPDDKLSFEEFVIVSTLNDCPLATMDEVKQCVGSFLKKKPEFRTNDILNNLSPDNMERILSDIGMII